MLSGKEFRIELIETDVTLVLARRKKKVNRKLNMLLKCTMWKERPKSKALGDIQVCFFVILKKQEIDFNSLVLILSIYLLERRNLVRLFYPHFLDVYVSSILTRAFNYHSIMESMNYFGRIGL